MPDVILIIVTIASGLGAAAALRLAWPHHCQLIAHKLVGREDGTK